MKKNLKLFKDCKKKLGLLHKQHLYRQLHILKNKKDFSSNDYLSLSQIQALRKQVITALQKGLPFTAKGSRLLGGQSLLHQQTEKLFAQFVGRPEALFFSSGWHANTGLIATLTTTNTALFSDQLNHASLIEGCRLSNPQVYIYPHKNLNKLEDLLKKVKVKHKIIITESVFSMDGTQAPLQELSTLALKHNALCIIDEAHATGIYGKKGAGLCTLLKEKSHIISVHPCGKALSTRGCFVAGPLVLKDYLINKCKSFIYTTASSDLELFLVKNHLQFLQKHPERRKTLKQKALMFRSYLKNIFVGGDKDSPIVPVFAKSTQKALKIAGLLQSKGYDIRAIRYPSVPKGSSRLRIIIHYNHTDKELKKLAYMLQTEGKMYLKQKHDKNKNF